jgi:hypothetical protein
MPAEAARLKRRIGHRDRRFFAAIACATLVGTPAIVLASHHGGSQASHQDATCIEADHAGVLGGGTYHYCGADAVAFCRRFADDDSVAAKCEALARASAGKTSRSRPGG